LHAEANTIVIYIIITSKLSSGGVAEPAKCLDPWFLMGTCISSNF